MDKKPCQKAPQGSVTVRVIKPGGVKSEAKLEDMSFSQPRHMPDGSIVYPVRGWEPPPPIEGYTRDPNNKFRFIRIWPECKFRREASITKPCGAIQISAVCLNGECPENGKPVTHAICTACIFRKT